MALRITRKRRTPPRPRRGRPPTHTEAWSKVSIVMFDRQVLALDRLTRTIRHKTGATLTRAEVIRSLLDALGESGLDVTTVASGTQLKRMVAQKLAL